MEFEERDITQSPEYIAELRKLGSMSTPTTVIGEQVIMGFDARRIKKALNL